ncbi:trypsin-like peptidase domain-containing protein [Streptomyces sp. NPDC127038]|uniref:trypsin-like peptidase domain-containing protein n=1 Tax=Streptomyces sp. NPDC127038 TaxID=3347114 RepID=UPI00364A4021
MGSRFASKCRHIRSGPRVTLSQLRLGDIETSHHCTVWISVDGKFRGSGFLVSPGLVITAAHVVADACGPAKEATVHHTSGTHVVPMEKIRIEPTRHDGSRFYPYPDLACLSVPHWNRHPVVTLASSDPEIGTQLIALGYSPDTPTPGVQPETLVLSSAGRSAGFMRVLGDGVKAGYSGSVLLGPDRLAYGVLKGSRSYSVDQGGWFVPVTVLAIFLGANSSPPQNPDTMNYPPTDAELVQALMAFPTLARPDSRYDLFEKIGNHLGLPHSFEVDDRSDRRDHLYRLVHRCRHYRDSQSALRAVYTAMEELVPYDAALERLRLVVSHAIGDWEGK